jgi:hypothetical protein
MLGKETVFSPRPIETIRFAVEMLTYETRRFERASALEDQVTPSAQSVVR